jgi:uncharacterized membrane protein HdeD (DUF308 family)
MSTGTEHAAGPPSLRAILKHELEHLRSHWLWILLFGILLVVAGTAAIVVPSVTIGTTFAVTIFLGALFMLGGVATIVSAFWIGKWSGFLIQLLVGLVYLACGYIMTENPVISAFTITVFIAVSFIVLGAFRSVGALVIRYPQWGWSLLNGVITLLAGIIIERQLPNDSLWVVGLLVGLEMLFNGWTWIMLSLVLRNLPADRPPVPSHPVV